jgi:hypothetical protein
MPGVTVEAASPALIEKVTSAVTDQAGVYRIENLFPGDDIFGTGKTALKFGVNKYNRQLVDDLTNRYNPIRPQTASVTWRDLDGDDVADGYPGCTPDARLRNQPGAGAGELRPGHAGLLGDRDDGVDPVRHGSGGSGHSARLEHPVQRWRPARAAPADFGQRLLVLLEVLRSGQDRQHPAELLRLHASADREPARRQRDHKVQRQYRRANPAAEPGTHGRE